VGIGVPEIFAGRATIETFKVELCPLQSAVAVTVQ
jgi:hypothetical protein